MKVLIVEDETAAYESLVQILNEINPFIQVVGNTESVGQTVQWLTSNPEPDLIFMDIHLSDGSSFLIFDKLQIEAPIIFTTAYDQYAIDAFKLNSVDYLLKPIKTTDLERALQKFNKWTRADVAEYLSRMVRLFSSREQTTKMLIPFKDKLVPIDLKDVSCFYTTDKSTRVCMKNGLSYPYAKTLEQIYASLNPSDFYRANKQFILSRDSIVDITVWFDNRLRVTLDTEVPEYIYVSKNRAADFKAWLISS